MDKIKCINGWTKQSMIEHVKTEFKGKSVNYINGCCYRGLNNTKCAVGMFIPDNLYHSDMESNLVTNLPNHLNVHYPLHPIDFVLLQDVHDSSMPETCLTDMLYWIETNIE